MVLRRNYRRQPPRFLLADMAEIFFAHNVSLRYAKISTLDERAEDSFTVFSPT